ncbi:MAG: DegT/DnrJ/EryC1/StrS family aminotransferase, partial [Anaerolineales bacterium]
MAKNKLAIHGESPVISGGTVKPWPPIDDVDRKMVLASLEGGQHTFGPNCKAFQEEFAAWNGNRYAITTNSGTAALHMCVASCG